MKKILFSLLAATIAIAFVSCEYDDSELTDRVNDLENRVVTLEQLCQQMNTNISSMQTLLNALQTQDYITAVTPITEAGKTIGYTISFFKGEPITIYHGQDGQDGNDGYTPIIGVDKADDNIYYWTLDGKWLTDDEGNKIKAQGTDGKDGQDGEDGQDGDSGSNGQDGYGQNGITPKLKIENDYWYVSYDNGSTWVQLGKATGADGANGDSMFSSVTEDEENVYFQFSNGTSITIPKSNSITSIELTYIPRYNDGKATVFYTTAEDSYVEFDFEVSPATAAADWKDISTIKAVYTETRAGVEFIDMDILEWTTDKTHGTITVKALGKNLSDDFFAGEQDASARLMINGDDINVISAYIPMIAKQTVKLTDYFLTTTFTVTNGKCNFPGADAIAGETNPYVIIDYGDGTYGVDSKHTYAKDADYTVKFYFEKPITEIDEYAFNLLTNLKSITIPKEVTKIGSYAFQYSLESIIFEKDSQLTHIQDMTFMNSMLKEITLPASIDNIGLGVFANCKDLKNINSYSQKYHSWSWPDYGETTLVTVVDNKHNILAYAGASLMDELLLGVKVIIKENAFTECKHLIKISFILEKIESYNMRNCAKLETVNLANTTSIGQAVFIGCKALQQIDAPVAAEIGANTFCQNESLTEISLGCADLKTLDAIGNENVSLQIIRIPSGVTSISNSFNKCAAVAEIYCSAATPPTLTDSFEDITTSTKIYVPTSSVDAYKSAAGWSVYADQIEGKTFE